MSKKTNTLNKSQQKSVSLTAQNGGNFFEDLRKVALSFLIVLVIYSNSAVILARSPLAFKLPIPQITADLFDVFSVFAYYETINRDFVIQGLKAGASPEDEKAWINLEVVDRYFPHSLGEQQMRLFLSKHYAQGSEFHQAAYKALAAKIRERYNREHPEAQVEKVAIGYVFWPRSQKGYRALKLPDTVQQQLLFVEGGVWKIPF